MTHRRNIVSINVDAPVEEIVAAGAGGPLHALPDLARRPGQRSPACCTPRTCWRAVQRQGAKLTNADAAPAGRAALVHPGHHGPAAPAAGVPPAARAPRLRGRRVRRADGPGHARGHPGGDRRRHRRREGRRDERRAAGGRRQHPGRGQGHDPRPQPRSSTGTCPTTRPPPWRACCSTRHAASPRSARLRCSTASASRWCAASGTSSRCCGCAPGAGLGNAPGASAAASGKKSAAMERTMNPAGL